MHDHGDHRSGSLMDGPPFPNSKTHLFSSCVRRFLFAWKEKETSSFQENLKTLFGFLRTMNPCLWFSWFFPRKQLHVCFYVMGTSFSRTPLKKTKNTAFLRMGYALFIDWFCCSGSSLLKKNLELWLHVHGWEVVLRVLGLWYCCPVGWRKFPNVKLWDREAWILITNRIVKLYH